MPAFAPDQETNGGRRRRIIAGVIFAFALLVYYLPGTTQQRTASMLRGTVLRPFIAAQERLVEARLNARHVDELQRQLDTLTAQLSTYRALEDENRTLRGLLELGERLRPAFRPASVLRPGNTDSESMFLVDVGTEDGVRVGSPVVDPHGLVGIVRQVRANTSVAMDWTHPEFRASAMLADGTSYGIVERLPGGLREQDQLILRGTAFFAPFTEGMLVLTSGFGILPRGIPIGSVESVAETEGQWRRSFLLTPMVQPASVTHVLVAVGDLASDMMDAWASQPAGTDPEPSRTDERLGDSLPPTRDSVGLPPRASPSDTVSGGRS
ncbi:MAG: rod shape-determining protein MreC [Gemmatimonadota bacterium]